MNEKGFTLVEVLVALVAGGLLLASISWVIAGLGDDLKEAENSGASAEILSLSGSLDDLLGGARFSDEAGNILPRSDQSLSFRTRMPMAMGGAMARASLIVQRGQDGQALVLDWPGQNVAATELISKTKGITLGYQLKEDPRFLNKITISIEGNEGSENLTIVPHIDTHGACIFDPISQRCRT